MKAERKPLSVEQCKDSGLALVLLSLLCYQAWRRPVFMALAIAFLLAAMTWPKIFRPFARLWFALSALLGTVGSRIVLTALFFLVVLPVGLVRRALGKDSMRLRQWRHGSGSVLRARDHRFVAKDLENPY